MVGTAALLSGWLAHLSPWALPLLPFPQKSHSFISLIHSHHTKTHVFLSFLVAGEDLVPEPPLQVQEADEDRPWRSGGDDGGSPGRRGRELLSPARFRRVPHGHGPHPHRVAGADVALLRDPPAEQPQPRGEQRRRGRVRASPGAPLRSLRRRPHPAANAESGGRRRGRRSGRHVPWPSPVWSPRARRDGREREPTVGGRGRPLVPRPPPPPRRRNGNGDASSSESPPPRRGRRRRRAPPSAAPIPPAPPPAPRPPAAPRAPAAPAPNGRHAARHQAAHEPPAPGQHGRRRGRGGRRGAPGGSRDGRGRRRDVPALLLVPGHGQQHEPGAAHLRTRRRGPFLSY